MHYLIFAIITGSGAISLQKQAIVPSDIQCQAAAAQLNQQPNVVNSKGSRRYACLPKDAIDGASNRLFGRSVW